MLDAFSLHPDVAARLGRDCVGDVLTYLWAVDCQTCGASLRDSVPEVCVNAWDTTATATLHHPACRRSEWNMDRPRQKRPYLTYITQCASVPGSRFAAPPDAVQEPDALRPMMMVNPGVEQILLDVSEDGVWSVVTNRRRYLGLRRPGEIALGRAITTGAVAVAESTIRIRVGSERWSAPGDGDCRAAVRSLGGILLVITAALGPDSRAVIGDDFFLRGPYEFAWLGLGVV